jgi:SagB-type dehydrogenase family enzyme
MISLLGAHSHLTPTKTVLNLANELYQGHKMLKTCLGYHRETSYDRFKMSGHSLDWANQPKVFKEYPGITPLALARELQIPKEKLSAILGERSAPGVSGDFNLEALSLLLLLSYTHTARARHPEGDFFFRSAASAGALYPTEVYVAARDVKGVDNGLYHFSIQNHSLDPLRKGDVPGTILGIEGHLTFFLTAIFFRSAWKYRARAYRYHLLDTGHVAENLFLALKALKLPFRMSYDFGDIAVNRLLGLDDQKEVTLAIIELAGSEGISKKHHEPVPLFSEPMVQASRLSAKEIDYPAVREIHQAGIRSVESMEERNRLRTEMIHELGLSPGRWTPVETSSSWPESTDYPDAVFRRRSRRNFIKKAMNREALNAFLDGVCRGDGFHGDQSAAVGFLVGRVEDMEPGFYLLDRKKESYALVSATDLIPRSTTVCLDQEWLVNAGVHFLFLANLDVLEKKWAARGYRYAMLTAGRFGERLYVAAEALGLGCCGIGAFYDGEAMEMLGLNQNSRLLYLVAVGNVRRT